MVFKLILVYCLTYQRWLALQTYEYDIAIGLQSYGAQLGHNPLNETSNFSSWYLVSAFFCST